MDIFVPLGVVLVIAINLFGIIAGGGLQVWEVQLRF